MQTMKANSRLLLVLTLASRIPPTLVNFDLTGMRCDVCDRGDSRPGVTTQSACEASASSGTYESCILWGVTCMRCVVGDGGDMSGRVTGMRCDTTTGRQRGDWHAMCRFKLRFAIPAIHYLVEEGMQEMMVYFLPAFIHVASYF